MNLWKRFWTGEEEEMSIQSQAVIEAKAAPGSKPNFDPHHPAEWLLDLGGRKALFHPELKQWMWFDALHEEWLLAGCRAGEAILMSYGREGGIKKLPQPGPVGEWCVYSDNARLYGPVRACDLFLWLTTGSVSQKAVIWSPLATDWLSVASLKNNQILFANQEGVTLLVLNRQGFSPLAAG